MSDEETPEADEAVPEKKRKLPLILSVLITLAAGGGAGYHFLLAPGSSAAAESGPATPPHTAPRFGPLVEMQPIVANLNDMDAGRFIKVTMRLETPNEEAQEAVTAALVPIRHRALLYFSGVTVEDTIGTENKRAISQHLKEMIDEEVGEGLVRRVFFTEFVVQ